MADEIFRFIIDGEFAVLDVVFVPKEYSRKDSYELISRNDIIRIKNNVRVAVVIESHDAKLAWKSDILLKFRNLFVYILEIAFSAFIGSASYDFDGEFRHHLGSGFPVDGSIQISFLDVRNGGDA